MLKTYHIPLEKIISIDPKNLAQIIALPSLYTYSFNYLCPFQTNFILYSLW